MRWQRMTRSGHRLARYYSAADLAVNLRLLRAFNDIAFGANSEEIRLALLSRAKRVVAGSAPHLPEDSRGKLQRRLASREQPITARM